MFRRVLLTIFLLSISAVAAVWNDTVAWDIDQEKAYSEWVKKNWGKDFFSKKTNADNSINLFHGIRVDCADNVYSARIIFAYLHGLPFVMNDPTGGKNLISNAMTRWDSFPEQDRIRKFLFYVYNIAGTKSLPKDSYPVKVSKETIVPGTFILTVEKNHHSWVIKNIFPTGIPHLVYNSTVGAYSSLVLQERKTWPNGEWVFEEDNTPAGNAGVRYWRKAADLKLPAWKATGYSEEQYSIKPARWKFELQKILQNSQETNQQKANRLIENVCADVQQRVDAVKESEAFLKSTQFQCLSEADFDTYSTPSRDHRLAEEIIELRNFLKKIVAEKSEISLNSKTLLQLQHIFPETEKAISIESSRQKSHGIVTTSICRSKYFSRSEKVEKTIDLAEIKKRLFTHRLSSNPNDPPELRFGESPVDYVDNCPSWGNLNLTYVE